MDGGGRGQGDGGLGGQEPRRKGAGGERNRGKLCRVVQYSITLNIK